MVEFPAERFEALIVEVADLARSGEKARALLAANQLVDQYPAEHRAWTRRATLFAMDGDFKAAVSDALNAIRCSPSNRNLYSWPCMLFVQLREFENCLQYTELGLAASDGAKATKAMHIEQLNFLAARSLYELGRLEEALERLRKVAPTFGLGRQGEPLLTAKELTSACLKGIKPK